MGHPFITMFSVEITPFWDLHHLLVGGIPSPLKKDGVRQLGL
jgi:hypothetical protein